ncbi:MAG TPA: hypothetical protein VIE88_04580, partial [Vicinamibacteria bacterium]
MSTESRRHKIPWRAILPPLVTASIFFLIFRKVPFARFTDALRDADYVRFFTALLPFSVFYFILDSVVLFRVVRWFHGELAFGDLLPVRAVDYLLSILNHRVSQGAMVVYLARRLSTSLLEIASSILFLDFLQKTHLILWAAVGMALVSDALPATLLLVPVGLAA